MRPILENGGWSVSQDIPQEVEQEGTHMRKLGDVHVRVALELGDGANEIRKPDAPLRRCRIAHWQRWLVEVLELS